MATQEAEQGQRDEKSAARSGPLGRLLEGEEGSLGKVHAVGFTFDLQRVAVCEGAFVEA